MAAMAFLTPPRSPRTCVECPSIAAEQVISERLSRKVFAFDSLPYYSNPSIWSELGQKHLYPRPLASNSPSKTSLIALTSRTRTLH